ncbi:MAG TPA: hypothetical protein DCF62_07345 [Porticoccaceae bacterium]|nr:hypothetical protein [Porticoccaceae bacterium]
MHVQVDLCLIPLGVAGSLAGDIAICQRIFEQRGLNHYLHAFGTNIEGEWDQVMDAVKACHEAVHKAGRARISSTLKIGTRTDKHQLLNDKIESVEKLLAGN